MGSTVVRVRVTDDLDCRGQGCSGAGLCFGCNSCSVTDHSKLGSIKCDYSYFVGQEFRQGTTEIAYVCFTMSAASSCEELKG